MENNEGKIKFNPLERKFYLKDKELELSPSFKIAKSEYIQEKENSKLKLFYNDQKELYSDFIKICSFLKKNNLWEDFEIKQSKEEIKNQLETEFIYLIGPEIELPSSDSYETPWEILQLP